MARLSYTVDLSLNGLRQFSNTVLQGSSSVTKILKQWGFLYRVFVQDRFDRYSKGQGDWPKLKESTIRRKKSDAILRDTNTMFMALTPAFANLAGSLELIDEGDFAVTVGFGGSARHPESPAVTVADVAKFHNDGEGRNPQREIIVMPDAATQKIMAQVAEKELQKELNSAGRT